MEPVVVVGAGLAGLSMAEGLLKKGYKVIVLERYPNVGGRVVTQRDPYQYEVGAGRIFRTHARVHALIRRFGLRTYPIGTEMGWMPKGGPLIPNPFGVWFAECTTALKKRTQRVLATHTLGQLIPRKFRSHLKQYPYWAELHMMRADLALPLFEAKAEMGTYEGYVGIQEGIDALTSKLREAVVAAGGLVLTRYRVEDVRKVGSLWELVGTYGKKAEAQPFQIWAERVVLATCRCSLGDFTALKGAPLLKQLQTSPLIRIYAAYPAVKGRVWFEDLPKLTTDSTLRFIIPIDPKKGLIMISYTDGPDTDVWRSLDGEALKTAIQKEVRALFPDRHIPDPVYLKKHDWPSGCTYWVPTGVAYDLKKAQYEAMHPAKRLWIVGESVSFQQGWMEGALETAAALLNEF